MPITNREEAKETGFAQVREALQSFEGDVVRAGFDQWGGKLVDDEGNLLPPREFLEVESTNIKPLEITEELTMDISKEFTFRVTCSDYKGSFWIEDFLASVEKAKLLIPNDLVGKRITWKKVTRKGTDPKYDATNFVIAGVKSQAAPRVVPVVQIGVTAPTQQDEGMEEAVDKDPMALALELAVGKTEAQFRSAISLHPSFVGNPLLPLAKAGAITAALVKEGKLVEVIEGNKTLYREP